MVGTCRAPNRAVGERLLQVLDLAFDLSGPHFRCHYNDIGLDELGPMHPGSLSEQYNVCGKPGCRCKDAKKPQKHGPYYQLSFAWRGKGRTRFVRAERLAEIRQKIANYKRFRELTDDAIKGGGTGVGC